MTEPGQATSCGAMAWAVMMLFSTLRSVLPALEPQTEKNNIIDTKWVCQFHSLCETLDRAGIFYHIDSHALLKNNAFKLSFIEVKRGTNIFASKTRPHLT